MGDNSSTEPNQHVSRTHLRRLWLWIPILGLWCWLLWCWLWRIWRRILPLRLRIPIWRRILPLWLWLLILLDRPGGDQSDAVVRMIHAASGGVVWHHQKQ